MKRLTAFGAVFAVAAVTVSLSGCGSAGPRPPAAGMPPPRLPVPGSGGSAPAAATIAADQTGITWASRESARIAPGTQTYTGDDQCTTNFVFSDDARNVYIGQAAHCASTGTGKDTNGCTTTSQPLGTPVTFNQAGAPGSRGEVMGRGELVYSSWISMQRGGERDTNACAYNDFALVKVAANDAAAVNPTVPHWGGPVGINTGGTTDGELVYSYGNSNLRMGITESSPQTGRANPTDPSVGGWSHALTSPTHTPGIPGDSGAAYLDNAGNALGTLSTIGLAIPIVNTIGDISHELAYAQTHSGIAGLRLVLGTAPFSAAR